MDDDLKTLCLTLFKGAVTTLDIYVIQAHVHGIRPNNTVICLDDNGSVIVDLEYDGYRASDFLEIRVTPLTTDQQRQRAPEVARELMRVSSVEEDVSMYARRGVARRVIKKLRDGFDARALKKALSRVRSSNIDGEFVRDVIYAAFV